MRNDRVYSQIDMPGYENFERPLRALRSVIEPDKFAVLILHRSAEDFRAVDTAQLSRLGPFLGPAMSAWHALAQERRRALLERQLSQNMGVFWLLFTRSGRVLDMSPQLHVQLAELSTLRLMSNGRLKFADPAAALAFRQALATAQAGRPEVITLSCEPSLRMLISKRSFGTQRAVIGILHRAPVARSLPVDLIAHFFGVSRSEARMVQLLCDGFSLREAAQALGWTLETARSCSKRIFARMGATGQADVLRKVLGSPIWLM